MGAVAIPLLTSMAGGVATSLAAQAFTPQTASPEMPKVESPSTVMDANIQQDSEELRRKNLMRKSISSTVKTKPVGGIIPNKTVPSTNSKMPTMNFAPKMALGV